MNQNERDSYYLEIAKTVSKRSTCYYGNLGCVIVDKDDNVISTGYLTDKSGIINCRKSGYCSFAEREGITDNYGTPEQCDYMFPEVSAILAADRSRLQDSSLYLYCEDLTGHIIEPKIEKTIVRILRSAGVKRIVLPKQ